MEGAVRRRPPEEGESYFMSMTDMMVGLLLIFIILLAYFALNLQSKTEELTGANRTRAEILNDLQQSLKDKGLQVEIDTKTGDLRLPDDVLRSEEHTSELQSLMRITYAVFCLIKQSQ